MKTLLQIGAGNIGRACIGRLFSASGYRIVFFDIHQDLLDRLSAAGEYYVHLVGKGGEETRTIHGVDSLTEDEAKQAQVFNEVSIITTAVGVAVLSKVAPLIARAITARFSAGNTNPLNIIACENAIRASSTLKGHVQALLSPEVAAWAAGKVAFPDAATDSIVPASHSDDPLTVTGEFFAEIIIDKTAVLGEIVLSEGLLAEENLDAYIERKLFTLNTGHAVAAYVGYLQGKSSIDEAVADAAIRATVLGAMRETGAVLIRRYGFNPETHEKYIQKIISRFENPYLHDAPGRVGREPMRKLSYNDRIIKPMRDAAAYGLPYEFLLEGARAAFLYDNAEDAESKKIQALRAQNALNAVYEVTGLHADNAQEAELARKIAERIA